MAHLQSPVGVYPKILHRRYIKNGRSVTPPELRPEGGFIGPGPASASRYR